MLNPPILVLLGSLLINYTLPSNPLECTELRILDADGKEVTIIGDRLILGQERIILNMPFQILHIQSRDGEWREPVNDCGGKPIS